MKTFASFLVLSALVSSTVGSMAACNLILGNEAGSTAGPEGGVVADARTDGPGVTPPDGPVARQSVCVDTLGGDWTACAGGGACVLDVQQHLFDGSLFSRIHATPQGLVAFGQGNRYLVADGTGGSGEPPARQLVLPNAIDITADDAFVYDFARTLDGLKLHRYPRGSDTADSEWAPLELGAFDFIVKKDNNPVIVAVDRGVVAGVALRTKDDGSSLGHLLFRWEERTLEITDDLAGDIPSDRGSFHTVLGAYGMARLAPGDRPTIEAFRAQPPVLPNVSSPATWTEVERSDLRNDAGGYEPAFEHPYLALNCTASLLMTTRWGLAPSVRTLERANAKLDLEPIVNVGAPAGDRYWAGVARWAVAADGNATYLARTGITSNGSPTQPGEVFVLQNDKLGELFVAGRFPTTGVARMLDVTACYLYWLDEAGALQRVRKPGPQCVKLP